MVLFYTAAHGVESLLTYNNLLIIASGNYLEVFIILIILFNLKIYSRLHRLFHLLGNNFNYMIFKHHQYKKLLILISQILF